MLSTYHQDILRSEARSKAAHTPTGSADSARLAAFAEQQLRAQTQHVQDSRSAFSISGAIGLLNTYTLVI
jgi:hypothetical protein